MNLRIGIPSIGMRGALTVYQQMEQAAISAARNNNAALWYVGNNPSGFVYQDSAGTIPATGTDPIGQLKDRVGSFNATQATAANKPTLELQANGYYGMRFDGVNDLLTLATPIGTAINAVTRICAYSNSSAANYVAPFAPSSNLTTNARIGVLGSTNGQIPVSYSTNDASVDSIVASGNATGLNVPFVQSVVHGSIVSLYVNGILKSQGAVPTGTWTVDVGRMGQSPNFISFGGTTYLYCASANTMPDPDRIAIERFAALLSGASYAG